MAETATAVKSLRERGMLRNESLARAVLACPRTWFAGEEDVQRACDVDSAVVIQRDSTGEAISSATSTALIVELLELAQVEQGQRILEIGTGVGFSTALLAAVVGPHSKVVSIEIDPEVAARAGQSLATHGFDNARVVCADGFADRITQGRFDRILVNFSVPDMPSAWLDLLEPGGMLVGIVQGPMFDFVVRGTARDGGLDVDVFRRFGSWNRLRGSCASDKGWFVRPTAWSWRGSLAEWVGELGKVFRGPATVPLPPECLQDGPAPNQACEDHLFWAIASLCGIKGNLLPAYTKDRGLLGLLIDGDAAVRFRTAEGHVEVFGNDGLLKSLCSALALWRSLGLVGTEALIGRVARPSAMRTTREQQTGQWYRKGQNTDLLLEVCRR